ncbi:MAG: ABC transporter permease [Planctomycetota bacterium]
MIGEVFELGLRNMRGYPLRTSLTTLGVVFGVASVILMRAVGAGAESELLKEMGKLGIDNVIVNSVKPPEKKKSDGRGSWIQKYGLTFKDVDHIARTVPGLRRVLPVHTKADRVWSGSRKVEATVYGVRPDHMPILGIDVARGRPLSGVDEERLARVCVVRPALLRDLANFDDPLGKSIQVGNELFTIVGVLEDRKVPGYASKALALDQKRHEVYVPFETLVKRRGTATIKVRTGSFEGSDVQINQLVVGVKEIDHVVEIGRLIATALVHGHPESDFEIVVPIEYLRQRKKTQDVFNYTFLAIAAISLLVGGIGIANIMLATVTERTREIGVRRALGARRADIVLQFLAETTTIATIGGVVGVLGAFAFDALLRWSTGWTTIISPSSIVLGLGVSMATGVLSGIFPARRAAYLDPIAALRHT